MKVIEQLQKALIVNIKNDQYLANEIKQILFSPIQNAILPYLLFSDLDVTFSYLHEKMIYDINFSFNLYLKAEDTRKLHKIHEKINEVIAGKSFYLEGGKVVNIKEVKFSMENGKDLTTQKLIMFYQASVR